METPGFIQAERNTLEKLRADIDYQTGQESAVQTDRQPRTEKIITHDDYQDQHAGENKAVVHSLRFFPIPAGGIPPMNFSRCQ